MAKIRLEIELEYDTDHGFNMDKITSPEDIPLQDRPYLYLVDYCWNNTRVGRISVIRKLD